MILGDPDMVSANRPGTAAPGVRGPSLTIDDIFSGHARRRPDALALADPINRSAFTDGEPRRLTYAEADQIISAIAARLRQMGLPTDAIIGIQLPNIVEAVLAMLGVLRAGMIVAPLPLLWRRADAVAALARVNAKAFVTCGHVGAFNHGQFATGVAADVFSIRYVCGFGDQLPDGVVPFDDLLTNGPLGPAATAAFDRQSITAPHIAAITFDVGEGGLLPVAHSHAELLAGGLALVLEGRLAQDAGIASTIAPTSFAGMCLTMLPWLLCGGTLVLHHPFDADALAHQQHDENCDAVILPGPVAFRLGQANAFAAERPHTVIAMWRAPERMMTSPAWQQTGTGLVDIAVFGEAAFAPARREADGLPRQIRVGPYAVPRGGPGGTAVVEFAQCDGGTLAVRGPMVPHHSFPHGIERSGLPHFRIGRDGMVDTAYPCRVDPGTNAITVTGPPAGIASVGGYRFALRDLREVAARIDSAATLIALPEAIVGQNLIGNATDRSIMQAALNAVGVNPIVIAAFRGRGTLVAAGG